MRCPQLQAVKILLHSVRRPASWVRRGKTLLTLAVAIATTLHAQELAPELAPLAAKHKSDIAALDAQKDAAIARVQQTYLGALDGAERTATNAGKLEVVAAISKEHEALQSGLMASTPPEGLPKILQSARKACLDGTARVTADAWTRQKAIDADYLRNLAGLQARVSGKPELATQINAEKKILLASIADSGGLVGLWTIHVKARSGLSMTDKRELIAGGKGKKGDGGEFTWKIDNNRLILTYAPGSYDSIELPPRNGEMTGRNGAGDLVTLTRK